MNNLAFQTEVVRIKGQKAGDTGWVWSYSEDKPNHVQVKWSNLIKTWVKKTDIAEASIPHYFTEFEICKRTGRYTYPKYILK